MFLFRDYTLNIKKEIRFALKDIYGIGLYKSNKIISKIGFSYPYFINNINSYQFSLITFLLKNLIVSEVRIKREIEVNILRLTDSFSYRGARHKMCLPVHGQRTRTNAGTQRTKRIKVKIDNKTYGNRK